MMIVWTRDKSGFRELYAEPAGGSGNCKNKNWGVLKQVLPSQA